MRLRQATSLWIAALMSATGALADVRGVRIPPSFTAQEAEVIGRDPRLVGIAKRCARQLRQAFDALADASHGSRVGARRGAVRGRFRAARDALPTRARSIS